MVDFRSPRPTSECMDRLRFCILPPRNLLQLNTNCAVRGFVFRVPQVTGLESRSSLNEHSLAFRFASDGRTASSRVLRHPVRDCSHRVHDAGVNRFLLSSTSGDLLADRRYEIGQSFSAEGDHAAAADLFAQTVERVPQWAPAWLALGLARERLDDREAAFGALRRARNLDPSGRLGAELHLARLEGRSSPTMPAAFVQILFDQYADRFDDHLVEGLHYRGPALIADALRRSGHLSFEKALDLGCGTGLMGRALAGRVETLDGVDLSPRMIEQAQRTGLYRTLSVGDLLDHLARTPAGHYDLVLAADVLVYIGALDAVMAGACKVLRPGGTLAFTVQALVADDGFALGPDLRFSHARAYIERALAQAGFGALVLEEKSTRQDGGVDVPGLVIVARRT